MAWNNGSWSSTAAGSLITVLDSLLIANSHWSVYDASAGTNAKVYRCYDAVTGCDFYLKIDDNYTAYAIVELWTGWDADTHTGTGSSRVSYSGTTYLFRINRALGGYYLSVHDNYFIYIQCATWQGWFIGRPNLFDTSDNVVMYCGVVGTGTQNGLASYSNTATNNAVWAFLTDEAGNHTTAAKESQGSAQSTYGSYKYIRGIDGKLHFIGECFIFNLTTTVLVGTLPGVLPGGAAAHNYGATVGLREMIDGEEYMWVGDTTNNYWALVRMD